MSNTSMMNSAIPCTFRTTNKRSVSHDLPNKAKVTRVNKQRQQ